MMQKVIVEDINEESSEEELVSEILEIRSMISLVKKKAVEAETDKDVEKLESLLRILKLEMIKRTMLLVNKCGLGIGLPMAQVLHNGGGSTWEPFYDDFSKLEEKLNRAYRAARDMLNNLSRLV
ncbi:MAG: hypothetical protein QXT26_00040 [Thermoproteota archaeon]